MSDFSSSLPTRTSTNGDVVAKICDGTTNTQLLAIDANGKVIVKLDDSAGNGITSQVNGSQQALDVGINVAGVQIDPRDSRALTASDVVTANQGDANTIANAWPVLPTDGTNSQSFTAAGEAKVSVTQALPAGSNNIGFVEANTRDGSGNQITSVGGGIHRGLDVSLMNTTGSIDMANPLPVVISETISGAVEVLDFKQATAVAGAASDSHTYTITSGKAFHLQKIQASGSGKIKVEVKLGTISSEVLKVVMFNSTSNPNCEYAFASPQSMANTMDIVVTITNLDLAASNVYSTIEGYEI
jgi:hypothetical protein